MMVTMPLGATRTKALSACAPAPSAASTFGAMLKESTRPPPTTEAFRRSRREAPVSSIVMMSGLHWLAGGLLDGRADARVGGAAADVGHRRIDIGVGGLRLGGQQSRRRHDLSGL